MFYQASVYFMHFLGAAKKQHFSTKRFLFNLPSGELVFLDAFWGPSKNGILALSSAIWSFGVGFQIWCGFSRPSKNGILGKNHFQAKMKNSKKKTILHRPALTGGLILWSGLPKCRTYQWLSK